jgi:hypothetical protein
MREAKRPHPTLPDDLVDRIVARAVAEHGHPRWTLSLVGRLSRRIDAVLGDAVRAEGVPQRFRRDAALACAVWRRTGARVLNVPGEDGWNFSDEGAGLLAALTTLHTLNVSRNKIGDAGAASLAALTGLHTLNVSDNEIGAAGATSLASLTECRVMM